MFIEKFLLSIPTIFMVFVMTISFLYLPCQVEAVRMQAGKAQEIADAIHFDETQLQKVILENGLIFSFDGVVAGSYICNGGDDAYYSDKYWYVDGFWGDKYVFGASGAKISITNTTNTIKSISWKDSNFCLGKHSIIPGIGGMKYHNIGNPSATPNTFLGAYDTVNVKVFIGEANWTGSFWQLGYDHIRTLKETPIHIRMDVMVMDENNHGKYYSVNSPDILLDKKIIEQYRKDD